MNQKHSAQQGRIYFWRHCSPSQSYQDWHFSGTCRGCGNLISIFDELQYDRSDYRTLTLSTPTQKMMVPELRSNRKFSTAQRLRITMIREDQVSSVVYHEEESLLILSVNMTTLEDWRSALQYVIEDTGLYRLDMEADRVWLWPYPPSN
ncbi:hypothetical protein Pla110_02930 [Polystyrenella longa]|uniref:Uncharacterized protein n=1 Tax=Polystyrenella longa TaxID=2528007 RepID=A0A518CH81_9PLAN|nr:hypothetical protein Pla110_02930 [Polystyrenella longa]